MASDYSQVGVSQGEGYWVEAGVTSYFVPTPSVAETLPTGAQVLDAWLLQTPDQASNYISPVNYYMMRRLAQLDPNYYPKVAAELDRVMQAGEVYVPAWYGSGVIGTSGHAVAAWQAFDRALGGKVYADPVFGKLMDNWLKGSDVLSGINESHFSIPWQVGLFLSVLSAGAAGAFGAAAAAASAGEVAAAGALALEAGAEAAWLAEAATLGTSELSTAAAFGAETIGATEMGMGQFDFLDVSGYADVIDPSFADIPFDTGYEFADVAFDPGFDPSLDFGSLDTGFDLPADQIDWGADFSTDPLQGADVGLDPWAETMQVDTGNLGLDVPDVSVQEIADATGMNVAEVSNLQYSFPDVSLNDVMSYAKRGLDLYRSFTSAQQQPLSRPRTAAGATRTVYDPRTGKYVQQPIGTSLTSAAPQRRTVTDPRTGQPVTVQWNAQTGKWEPVNEWIAGVPNWAVIAGGGAVLLLLFARKRKSH
jgi:hypothetical protein